MRKVLSFSNVDFLYNSEHILNDVSFSIDEKEFIFLIGKSGSGKSTLLRLVYAALQPENGEVESVGFILPTKKKNNILKLRRKLGIVFQEFRLLKDRTVSENLAFVLQAAGGTNTNIKRKVNDVLSEVGLSHKVKSYPNELSGGELQRVAIARAIINDPLLILADEPTGNLDPETSNDIFELLKKINSKGTAVLFATHNYEFVRKSDKRILRLEKGKVSEIQKVSL